MSYSSLRNSISEINASNGAVRNCASFISKALNLGVDSYVAPNSLARNLRVDSLLVVDKSRKPSNSDYLSKGRDSEVIGVFLYRSIPSESGYSHFALINPTNRGIILHRPDIDALVVEESVEAINNMIAEYYSEEDVTSIELHFLSKS